jgi:hypothetical protein
MTDILFSLLYILAFVATIVFIFWNFSNDNIIDIDVYNWNTFKFDNSFY